MNSELEDRRVRKLLWESLARMLEDNMKKHSQSLLEDLEILARQKGQKPPKMPSLKRAVNEVLQEMKGRSR